MALTPSGARVRSLVSARESKRVELTGSVLTYNTLNPGSRLFLRLAWPRRIKHWSGGGRYGHMPHSLPFTFTFSAGLPHLHPCLPLLWTAGPDVPRHHRRRRGPTHRGVRGERGAAAGQCGTQQAVTGRTRWPCRGAQPSTAWRCPPGQGPCFVLCYMHPFCTLSPFFSSGFSPPFPPSSLVSAVPGPVFLFQNTNRCNTVQLRQYIAGCNPLRGSARGGKALLEKSEKTVPHCAAWRGPCGAELTVRGNMQRRLGYWRKNCGGLRADRQLASLPGGGVGGRPCEGGAGGGGQAVDGPRPPAAIAAVVGEGAMQVQAGGG